MTETNLSKLINNIIKKFSERNGKGAFLQYQTENEKKVYTTDKLNEIMGQIGHNMDKKMSDVTRKQFLKNAFEQLTTLLKPLYNDINGLDNKENILASMLVSIGKIVENTATLNEKDLKEKLAKMINKDATYSELDEKQKGHVDGIVTIIQETFETDINIIYANLKQMNMGAHNGMEQQSQKFEESLKKLESVETEHYSKSITVKPITETEIKDRMNQLINGRPDTLKTMASVYRNLNKQNISSQVGGHSETEGKLPVVAKSLNKANLPHQPNVLEQPQQINEILTETTETPTETTEPPTGTTEPPTEIVEMSTETTEPTEILNEISVEAQNNTTLGGKLDGRNTRIYKKGTKSSVTQEEFPKLIQAFMKKDKSDASKYVDPVVNMEKIVNIAKMDEGLKKNLILNRSDKNFSQKAEYILRRCFEIEVLIVVEYIKVMYFVGLIVLLKKLNSNLYSFITKIYYSLDIKLCDDNDFLAPFNLITQAMYEMSKQKTLLDNVNKLPELLRSDKIPNIKQLTDTNVQKGVLSKNTANNTANIIATNYLNTVTTKPPQPSDYFTQSGGRLDKSRIIGLDDKKYFSPDIAKELTTVARDMGNQYNTILSDFNKQLSKGKKVPYVTTNDFRGETEEESNTAVHTQITDAIDMFRRANLNNMTKKWTLHPSGADLNNMTGGGDKWLFNVDKENWTELGDISDLREYFFRCHIIQIIFLIEYEKAMVAGGSVLVEFIRYYKLLEIILVLLSLFHIVMCYDKKIKIPPAFVRDADKIFSMTKHINDMMQQSGKLDAGIVVNGKQAKVNLSRKLYELLKARETDIDSPVLGPNALKFIDEFNKTEFKPLNIQLKMKKKEANLFKERITTLKSLFDKGDMTDDDKHNAKKAFLDFVGELVHDPENPMGLIYNDTITFDEAKNIITNLYNQLNITKSSNTTSGGGYNNKMSRKIGIKHHRQSRYKHQRGGDDTGETQSGTITINVQEKGDGLNVIVSVNGISESGQSQVPYPGGGNIQRTVSDPSENPIKVSPEEPIEEPIEDDEPETVVNKGSGIDDEFKDKWKPKDITDDNTLERIIDMDKKLAEYKDDLIKKPNYIVFNNLSQALINVHTYVTGLKEIKGDDKEVKNALEIAESHFKKYVEFINKHEELRLSFLVKYKTYTYFDDLKTELKGDKLKTEIKDLNEEIKKIRTIEFKESTKYEIDNKQLYNYITEVNETVLGQARVIVSVRDQFPKDKYDDDLFKQQVNDLDESKTMVLKSGDNCVKLSCFCKQKGYTDKGGKCYGVFRKTFINPPVETIYKEEFENELIDNTILNGGNLIVFGFGFSGSGKTHILLNDKNNLMTKIVEYVKEKQIGAKISVTFEELYPIANKEGNFIITKYDDINEYTKKDDFDTHFAKIEQKRRNTLRIAPTPNNKDSSRSHMFIVVKFKLDGGKEGKLTLVDMAGAENTIEIKKQFLVSPKITKYTEDGKHFILEAEDIKDKDKKDRTFNKKQAEGPRWASKIGEKHGNYYTIKKYTKSSDAIFTYISSTNTASYVGKLLKDNLNDDLIKAKLKDQFGDDYTKIGTSWMYPYIGLSLMEIMLILNNKPLDYTNYIDKHIKLYGSGDLLNVIEQFLMRTKDSIEITESGGSKFEGFEKEVILNIMDELNLSEFRPWVEAVSVNQLTTFQTYKKESLNLKRQSDGIYEFDINDSFNLEVDKKIENFTIKSPFIALLLIIENKLRNITYEYIKSKSNKNIDSTKKGIKGAIDIYIILVLKVILAYVNLIVKQGKGIVTTLEHLKYTFLYNTGSKIGLINYNKQNTEHKFTSKLISNSATYNIERDGMKETVEMGNMKQTKMIEQLVKYSAKESINWDKTTKVGGDDVLELPKPVNAKYVMITAIIRGKLNEKGEYIGPDGETNSAGQNHSKYCSAAVDTLEFAGGITSGVGNCPACKGDTCSVKGGAIISAKYKNSRKTKKRGHRNGKRSLHRK